jgi:hypothetical protein
MKQQQDHPNNGTTNEDSSLIPNSHHLKKTKSKKKSTIETTSVLEMDQLRSSDTKHKSKKKKNRKSAIGHELVEANNSLPVTIPTSFTTDIEAAPSIVDASAKNNDDGTDQKKQKEDEHIKEQKNYRAPITAGGQNDASGMNPKKRHAICFAATITLIVIVLAIAIPTGVILKSDSPSQTDDNPSLSLECPEKCKGLLTGTPVTVNTRELQQAIFEYLKDPLSSPYGSVINCWDVSQVSFFFTDTPSSLTIFYLSIPQNMI